MNMQLFMPELTSESSVRNGPFPTEYIRNVVNPSDFPKLMVLISGEGEMDHSAEWGFVPPWVRDSEHAREIGSLRYSTSVDALFAIVTYAEQVKRKRCCIPVLGFAIGSSTVTEGVRNYSAANGEIVYLAGVLSDWKNSRTQTIHRTFAIITQPIPASAGKRQSTDWLPFVFSPDEMRRWLQPTLTVVRIRELLQPQTNRVQQD